MRHRTARLTGPGAAKVAVTTKHRSTSLHILIRYSVVESDVKHNIIIVVSVAIYVGQPNIVSDFIVNTVCLRVDTEIFEIFFHPLYPYTAEMAT